MGKGIFGKFMDDILGDPFGSYEAEAGAKRASAAQADFAQQGIDEQRRQYDINRATLDPFVQAGYGAIADPYQPQLTNIQSVSSVGGGGGGSGAMSSVMKAMLQNSSGQGLPQGVSASGGIPQGARQKPSFGPPQAPQFGAQGNPGTMGFYSGLGGSGAPLLQEFTQGGSAALAMQQALAGTSGPEAQAAAIAEIENSPEMLAMMRQGENAMLQNASATGGLRGGNLQGALATFRPQMLSAMIDKKYGQLGGLASAGGNIAQYLTGAGQQATGQVAQMGQASAAGQAAMGQQSAQNISNLLGQQGSAVAGGHLASGSGNAGSLAPLVELGGTIGGAYMGMGF